MKLVHDIRKELHQRTREVEVRKRVVERTAQTNAVLADETSRWMAGLPANVRPIALARKFPRIANSIADLWHSVASCEEYLASLVIDLRGNRTGFPPDVATELRALRTHYADLHPSEDSSWGLVPKDD